MADNTEPPIQASNQDEPITTSRDPKPTLPVVEEMRLKNEELRIEMCTKEDMFTVVRSSPNLQPALEHVH